jgi:HD-GYP domain-containing protein (c-di-GMP phosphodiesterase class II)
MNHSLSFLALIDILKMPQINNQTVLLWRIRVDQRRISMADITVGQPLPWDVFDSNNKLLLRKGSLVQRDQQIEKLIERGLFAEAQTTSSKSENKPVKQQEKSSALRFLNLANKRLERLLFSLNTEPDVQAKILEVATVVKYAVDLNPDITLGCILLNQSAGNYVIRHCIDTAVVSLLVAQNLNKTPHELISLAAAALTMNVGMLRHQEQFQNKVAALSSTEVEIIKSHPQTSVNLLSQAGVNNKDWLTYVLMHHENEDGSGYPLCKSGIEIPQNAKILAIADRYCARVSTRAYRKSLLPNAALRDILLTDKKNIDPMLAAVFVRELGIYPMGTYVRLENGEIAVVTGKGSSSTTPYVHAFIGPRGAPLSFPIKRDTAKNLFAIREVLHREQASLRFSLQQIWGDEASL